MNKIVVTRYYPVSKLPPDLREGFDPSALVMVIVEGGDGMPKDVDVEADKMSAKQQD
jgi:hypothetical protein